jgi:SAM-dependent methyltransferase
MRLLVRMFDVASMTGVELAEAQVARGRTALAETGLEERVRLIVGDATRTDLSDGEADFVWGEDAWCYVPDKRSLVGEAARIVRSGGTVAFTDWVEGPSGLDDEEADHVLQTMSFPNFQSIDGYTDALTGAGLDVVLAEDTGRFGPAFALYAEAIDLQYAFDALELFDFNRDVLDLVLEELRGLARLGADGKLVQGRFVARKP